MESLKDRDPEPDEAGFPSAGLDGRAEIRMEIGRDLYAYLPT